MGKPNNTLKFLILLMALLAIGWNAWHAVQVYEISNRRALVLKHFSEINDIYYGLLSVNEWETHVRNIADRQIENFEFNERQDELLRAQITALLNDVVDRAYLHIEENDAGLKNKIRKLAVNTFMDQEEMRAQVPGFTETIMQNLHSEESKERLRALAQQKLDEITAQTYDSLQRAHFSFLFNIYDVESKDEFNAFVSAQADDLESQVEYHASFIMISLIVFLLAWFLVWRRENWRKMFFFCCVLLGLLALIAGLSSPMIEIDARISKVDFVLLGEHILFTDQILFYRSKSILEVVQILLQSTHWNSVFVGVLILAFSVILPLSKLITNALFLWWERIRRNKVAEWLAFYSAKWSMADVMVVAIFMSYVAFDGILDDQLQLLERNTEILTSITTNNTSLRAGFFLFLAYVLYSLVLSELLKSIIRTEKNS